MRKSTVFLMFSATSLLALAMLGLHTQISSKTADKDRAYRARLVRELQLTDLALFTEARYTRHLAMADLHAAFQDHPVALEHFPSGALTLPRHRR